MFADFFAAYLEAAIWSSTDDEGTPLYRNYSAEDLEEESRARLETECRAFYEALAHVWQGQRRPYAEYSDDELAGHDLWLTQNGHGSGYWDGAWSEPAASQLTKAAKQLGERWIYTTDEGRLAVA